jgi:ElaB/YqjD/DUF883 family membrane-anchored ribosome-binding protein
MGYKNGVSIGDGSQRREKSLEQTIYEAREARKQRLEEIKDHINALSRAASDSLSDAAEDVRERWSLTSIARRRPWLTVGVSLVGGVLAGRAISRDSETESLTGATSSSFGHSKSPIRTVLETGLVDIGGMVVAASLRMLRQHFEAPAHEAKSDSEDFEDLH